MNTLVVTRDATFSEIEDAFQAILNSNNTKLRLPNSLKDRGAFGMEGLVSQLIATWLRNQSLDHTLHTYCDSEDGASFDDFGSSFYGMVALRLSSNILSHDLKSVSADFALRQSYTNVRNVINGRFQDAFKGLYIAIPSIKANGINREFNCPFYAGEKVVSRQEFKRIVTAAIDKVIPQKAKRAYIDNYVDHISEIIRELFDNTHSHGRTDHEQNILSTNFRAAIFNVVDVNTTRLDELSKSKADGFLKFMIESRIWMDKHERNLPVLDITIVDAGPGYARKWTGKSKEDLTLDQEIDAVYSCFQTSGTSSDNFARGMGLTLVLKDLAKVRGWFRLRTGSVAVSKSFFLGEESPHISKDNIKSCGNFIEGTSFNIVIPLVNVTNGDE